MGWTPSSCRSFGGLSSESHRLTEASVHHE
uniref:Uncharacterized protein n=1 Tax=Lepeophtheirus salmonis TaxID=72036 RepID=A0A0K2UDP8_LEPSM